MKKKRLDNKKPFQIIDHADEYCRFLSTLDSEILKEYKNSSSSLLFANKYPVFKNIMFSADKFLHNMMYLFLFRLIEYNLKQKTEGSQIRSLFEQIGSCFSK